MAFAPWFRRTRYLKPLLLQAGAWVVVASAVAAMLVLTSPAPNKWSVVFRVSFLSWAPWMLFTPGIFWLCDRYAIGSDHFWSRLSIHVVAGMICTLLTFWWQRDFVRKLPGPVSAAGASPFSRGLSELGVGSPETRGTFSTAGPVSTRSGPDGFDSGFATTAPGSTETFSTSRVGAPVLPPATSGLRTHLQPFALQANVGFGVYLVIASLAHALGFYRRARERDQQAFALVASRDQAKLDALRLQLHPHFLFNTLNAISSFIQTRPREANTLVLNLSELLRASLETTDHEITLGRELALLDAYLAIEQVRLGDRLRIVRDIPSALLGAYVPVLILQPLAENAVRHGIGARIAPGTLTVRASRKGDRLHLCVADDGVGLSVPDRQIARRGIGLANIEERLRMLHKGNATFDLRPNLEQGISVEISFPFHLEPTQDTPVDRTK